MAVAQPTPRTSSISDWPAVVVAVGILLLLGAVLVTATLRWSEAEVRDMLGVLAPVLGVVTGAFVTYFFTRQATAAATTAAQMATDAATQSAASAHTELQSRNQEFETQLQRSKDLHNALSAALALVDTNTAKTMRDDPSVRKALS